MRERHAVAVVILAYNYAHFLPSAAESVLSQGDVDVRLIIVDDCSTDGTPAVTSALSQDPRVQIVRNEPNRGQIPSMNHALSLVDEEFVVKLDADDLLTPGSLARSVALLENEPDVSFVYGWPRHFSGDVPDVADHPAKSWSIWPGRRWFERRSRDGRNVISQPEVVMRTASLRQVLPVPADLPHTSDLYLWLRLSLVGDVGRVNGPPQALYRVHDQSMQRTVNAGRLFDLEARRDTFATVFAQASDQIDEPEALEHDNHLRLAACALDNACRAYERGRVDAEPIAGYQDFALALAPDARALPEWTKLERRMAVGADRAQRRPRFVAAAISRRARETLEHRRWTRTGEW